MDGIGIPPMSDRTFVPGGRGSKRGGSPGLVPWVPTHGIPKQQNHAKFAHLLNTLPPSLSIAN